MCITVCMQCKRDLRFVPNLEWSDKPNVYLCTDCESKSLDMVIGEASLKMFHKFKHLPFIHGTAVTLNDDGSQSITVYVDNEVEMDKLLLIPAFYEGFTVLLERTGPFQFQFQ